MAYLIKYFIRYKRRSGNPTYIHIEEKDYAGSYTTLDAQNDPLEISFSGDPKDIFKPTIGSGAKIKVVADPLQLIDLFTDDPFKYRVKVYNGGTLMWQGFVDQNIYNESFATKNSLITINCNDGMTVLEQIPYALSDTSLYTDVSSFGHTIENIFKKTGLEINGMYKSSDLGVYAKRNPFLYADLMNDNFADENAEPMSCRDVLDTILKPLGLTLKIRGDYLYLIDPISLANPSNGYSYGVPAGFWGGYEGPISTLGGYLEVNNPKWYNDITLDIVPKQTKVNVDYDPYAFTSTSYDFNNESNWSNPGTWDASSSGSYTYYINSTVSYKGWEASTGSSWGLKQGFYDAPTYFLKLRNTTTASKYTFPQSFVSEDSSLNLHISFDAYVSTINDIPYVGGTAYDIWYMDVSIAISIGNQYYGHPYSGSYRWNTGKVYRNLRIIQPNIYPAYESRVNDTWTNVFISVPLNNNIVFEPSTLRGEIGIEITNKWGAVYPAYNSGYVKNVMLKNPKIQIVNSNSGTPITNNSKRYIGTPASAFSLIGGTTINTKQGTYLSGVPAKAVFLYTSEPGGVPPLKSGRPIPGWTFNPSIGTTDANSLNSNEFILNNYLSQYSTPKHLINGTFNVKDNLLGVEFKLIKDTPRWGNKAFYITSGTYNDRRETMSVEMIECVSTRL